jgi:hypothetical protein
MMVSNSGRMSPSRTSVPEAGVALQGRGVDDREIELLVACAQPVEQLEGLVQHPLRPGAVAIHLVDDDDRPETHLERLLGHEAGLRHRPVDGWSPPGPRTSRAWAPAQTSSPSSSATLSGGRIEVKVFGAGELVPAFEVFDAVSSGTAEMGHGGAYYWKGKSEAAQFFSACPSASPHRR